MKKVLFVISTAIKRNKIIQVFKYIKDIDKSTNQENSLGAKNEKTEIIKLIEEPIYLYRVHYYDDYKKEKVFPDKDSINLIQIIPNLEQLKLCKLVTDTYNNKSGCSFKKFSRYTSVLPPIENFDKLIMMIFAPKYKMVGYKNRKSNNIQKYIGFQSYELTKDDGFSKIDYNDENFLFQKAIFIKLDYVFTNYHLKIIDEIRVMLNEMVKFRFISKKVSNDNSINSKTNLSDMNKQIIQKERNNSIKIIDDDEDLSKEEFDELYEKYKIKAKTIIDKIHLIVNEKKIRNISNEKYQELFDYINEEKLKNAHLFPIDGENRKKEISLRSKPKNFLEEKDFDDSDDESDNSINDEKKPKEKLQVFTGYINEINELKKKVKEDDFLQLHEPIAIDEDYIFNNNDIQKELFHQEKKIKNLYKDVILDLKRMEKLAFEKEAVLFCTKCFNEIMPIKKSNPLMTNPEIGEHKIMFPYDIHFNQIFNNNDINEIEKNPNFTQEDDKNQFIEKLNILNISFDNLLACPSYRHIIGYARNGEKFIYYGSDLTVKYPDQTFDKLSDKNIFINDFESIYQKVKIILEEKDTEDFKKKIFCKLCNFYVNKNLKEFDSHLKDCLHLEKLKELQREFI